MKLADVVLESICYPLRERKQCRDVNTVRILNASIIFTHKTQNFFQAALELALSVADPDAVTRYIERGVTMTFGDDLLLDFADSWKFDDGLRYTNVRHP